MRFDLTDDQRQLRTVVRRLLAHHLTPARLRELWNTAAPRDRDCWRELGELGLAGIPAPQSLGGGGGSLVDVVVALEQAGYYALPGPLMESAAVLAPLITHQDAAGIAAGPLEKWAEPILAGRARVALWLHAESAVAHARQADVFLVVRDDGLHLVPRADARVEPVDREDPTLGWGAVEARTGPDTVISADRRLIRQVRSWASLGTSSLLLGVTQCLLDRTVDYAQQRQQFGRPIGSFQALQHALADAAVGVEAARGLVWYAAHASAVILDDHWMAVDAAAGAINDAGRVVNRLALQFHGGIGFTQEFDLHFWLKRGLALQSSNRTVAAARERIAAALLDQSDRRS